MLKKEHGHDEEHDVAQDYLTVAVLFLPVVLHFWGFGEYFPYKEDQLNQVRIEILETYMRGQS